MFGHFSTLWIKGLNTNSNDIQNDINTSLVSFLCLWILFALDSSLWAKTCSKLKKRHFLFILKRILTAVYRFNHIVEGNKVLRVYSSAIKKNQKSAFPILSYQFQMARLSQVSNFDFSLFCLSSSILSLLLSIYEYKYGTFLNIFQVSEMFSLNELKIFFYIDRTDFTAYICHLLHLEDLFVLADFRSSCPEMFYKKSVFLWILRNF